MEEQTRVTSLRVVKEPVCRHKWGRDSTKEVTLAWEDVGKISWPYQQIMHTLCETRLPSNKFFTWPPENFAPGPSTRPDRKPTEDVCVDIIIQSEPDNNYNRMTVLELLDRGENWISGILLSL
ncbi:hypothetical protein RUM43_000943 [Polyplax serrata]|uniref:Uncharacterized protein n=1 Tax=Polyplax serrata TaxID=468196 RepID=A0AAN8SHZ3_POLSC